MKTRWTQAYSLAMLSFIVTCMATLDTRSFVSTTLDTLEDAFKDDIEFALSDSDGVLAQFTMGHKLYSNT